MYISRHRQRAPTRVEQARARLRSASAVAARPRPRGQTESDNTEITDFREESTASERLAARGAARPPARHIPDTNKKLKGGPKRRQIIYVILLFLRVCVLET
jgi:hypothetical protein